MEPAVRVAVLEPDGGFAGHAYHRDTIHIVEQFTGHGMLRLTSPAIG